jgi:hypothetical protein
MLHSGEILQLDQTIQEDGHQITQISRRVHGIRPAWMHPHPNEGGIDIASVKTTHITIRESAHRIIMSWQDQLVSEYPIGALNLPRFRESRFLALRKEVTLQRGICLRIADSRENR